MRSRIAVLASGRGSNLEALLDYLAGHPSSGVVVLVASDRPAAGALAIARTRAIETATLDTGPSRDDSLEAVIRDHAIDLVVLAGYLSLVPRSVIQSFRGRILNVHPALLPAFGGKGMYGSRIHRAVLASGARVSGATAHFVDEIYDHGAIIAQWPVPIFGDDTELTLAARVLRAEHVLLPRVVDGVARGLITLGADNRVRGAMDIAPSDAVFRFGRTPHPDLGASVDTALALARS